MAWSAWPKSSRSPAIVLMMKKLGRHSRNVASSSSDTFRPE